jgi:hypothetical protein
LIHIALGKLGRRGRYDITGNSFEEPGGYDSRPVKLSEASPQTHES